jgi:hypothetical protein
MASQIIAALRRHAPQLRGNTYLVAVELAHRMNGQGYGRVSYQFLAWKAHCCRRTAITQIAKLVELRLIRKTTIPTTTGYPWNLYHYIGPRVHTASPPVPTHGAKPASTLPEAKKEKESSLAEALAKQKKWFPNLTPGSDAWVTSGELIARLEALIEAGATQHV